MCAVSGNTHNRLHFVAGLLSGEVSNCRIVDRVMNRE